MTHRPRGTDNAPASAGNDESRDQTGWSPEGRRFQGRVAASFDAAAESYDAHSAVQRHAARRLAGIIANSSLLPRARVLEVGCGTGHLTRLLSVHLSGARILATDIAPAMVAACRLRLPQHDYAVMDGTRPGVAGGFDLVCANLAAQWFADLPAALARLAALLVPGGLLALSLLGEGSFREWRAAHAALGLAPGTPPFPSAADCHASFPAGALQLDVETHVDRPDSALGFLRSLRALGADTAAPGHEPLTAGQLRRVMQELGAAPAITYQLIYASWRHSR
jgi:malonyl-CoA O-methyltransferase